MQHRAGIVGGYLAVISVVVVTGTAAGFPGWTKIWSAPTGMTFDAVRASHNDPGTDEPHIYFNVNWSVTITPESSEIKRIPAVLRFHASSASADTILWQAHWRSPAQRGVSENDAKICVLDVSSMPNP